jgi:hypothetical protein
MEHSIYIIVSADGTAVGRFNGWSVELEVRTLHPMLLGLRDHSKLPIWASRWSCMMAMSATMASN